MGRLFGSPGRTPKRPYKFHPFDRDLAVNILIDVGQITGSMPLDLEVQGEGYNVILPLEGLIRLHQSAYERGREHGCSERSAHGALHAQRLGDPEGADAGAV